MTDTKTTPMLRQYRRLKGRYPDALLFYRLGDFYELFEDDARTAARELNLVLTSRRFSKALRLPMCGVPYRTVTSYVSRLLKRGHKIAIAEQLEDARRVKGLVKREVVRVITPGTVVEEDLLPAKTQNLLVAIVPGNVPDQAAGRISSSRSETTHLPGLNLSTFGLAVVELSTGEFAATQAGGWLVLIEELQRLRPAEIVLPSSCALDPAWTVALQAASDGEQPVRISPVPDEETTPESGRSRLVAHFGVALEGCEAENCSLATAAAGSVLYYLQQNQVPDSPGGGRPPEDASLGASAAVTSWPHLAHLRSLVLYDLSEYVGLDATTCRNLELLQTLREGRIEGSLFGLLDRTETAMGSRLLRRWLQQPLLNVQRIRARLDAIEELLSPPLGEGQGEGERFADDTMGPGSEILPAREAASAATGVTGPYRSSPSERERRKPFLRADLRQLLDGMYDVERLVGRVGFGTANARDLVALRRSLARIPRIKALLAGTHSGRLCALDADLDELADVTNLIAQALVKSPPILIREGGLIQDGYNADLDALRKRAAQDRDWLAAFEAAERVRTGIPNLRIKYNQVFGFFIEVTRSHLGKVPPEYERRATVRSAERFVTPELKAREAEILTAEDRADDLEYELFVDLRRQVAAQADRLLAAARVLAELDALAALAEVAARQGYVRPDVDDGDVIDICEGRHPVVEQMLPGGEPFVPNDTRLSSDERLLLITGPNMAGKSVLVRQVALIVLLAQIGSFVPASSARIGLVDRMFTRVGATDDITQGRSTFLVEMSETARILARATPRSLVILDEVGRGTSTYDGMSLAWAVATELHDRVGARTLFATHYHELTSLPDRLPASRNYSLAVAEREDRVIFLRRLVPGGADKSYGLYVARLAGLPERVVAHAQEVMDRLEGDTGAGESGDLEIRAVRAVQEMGEGLLVSADDRVVWGVIRDLYSLDIANLTPVRALVILNEFQVRLREAT